MKKWKMLIAIGSLTWMTSSVSADDVPNLIGTWSGSTTAVHVGDTPYRDAAKPGVTFGSKEIEFTYTISEQKGRNFSGTLSSMGRTETIIGAVEPRGKNGVILDDDGQYSFTLNDDGSIDTCYAHANLASKVVACWTLTRK